MMRKVQISKRRWVWYRMKNTEGTVKKKVCRAAVRHKDRVGRNEVALPRGRQHTQRRAGREQNPWKERYQSQSNGNPSQKSIKCFSGVSQQASSKEVLTDSVIIMPFGAVGSPWPDTATLCSLSLVGKLQLWQRQRNFLPLFAHSPQ